MFSAKAKAFSLGALLALPTPGCLDTEGAQPQAGRPAQPLSLSGLADGSPNAVGIDQPPCLDPGDPSEEAYHTVTGPSAGRMILPNGRVITPTGTQVKVGVFPMNALPSHDGSYVFSSSSGDGPRYIQQIDVATGRVVATLRFTALFQGLALSPEGDILYAAGGEANEIYAIAVGAPGLTLLSTWPVEGYPMDLRLTDSGRKLLLTTNMNRKLVEFDTTSGAVIRSIDVDFMPYQIAVSEDESIAYVSQWSERSISVVDLRTGRLSRTLETSKNPAGLLLSARGERLYVTASDGDLIEVFDTGTGRVVASAPMGIYAQGKHGASPNSLALSADGNQLFVANAGDNAVEVYDPQTLTHLGAVPTAWYPTAVKVAAGSDTLVVVNGKGFGAGPSRGGAEASDLMDGQVSLISLPLSVGQLSAGQAQVISNNSRALTLHDISCQGKMFPVPSEGSESPIEHVVLIVRENKTYDAYLGDLEVGDGDPDLVLFGEQITPNTHELARQFTLLDNFYTDSEDSDQGHLWLTGALVNDYAERLNAAKRTLLTGVGRASDLETHYIFNQLMRNGIDWITYGEVVGLEVATMHNIDLDYPGVFFNMLVKDQLKAEYVAGQINKGVMPSFTYLLLPNDHTHGTDPGKPTPESMISDNDYAVGLVVDAISHSEFWPTTAIFIVEDDPQTGADHIEAHRSPALVVSPWSKRGHVSSVLYSIPSILRTMGLMLDMPPLTQYDAMALPMYDAFTAVPDFAPYDVVPRLIPDEVNPKEGVGAEESSRMDFRGPDRNPGLGDLLWRYRKGTAPPRDGERDSDSDDDSDEGVGEGWDINYDFGF